jgi:DNA-binding transcriptional LysR family regulator
MRQEINGLKDKLSGEIRIAAIPTVLGMVASLTTPFRARYPDVRFRVASCTSADVLGLLENLEVDAGPTYIENEPIGHVRTIPLYNASYRPHNLFLSNRADWPIAVRNGLCIHWAVRRAEFSPTAKRFGATYPLRPNHLRHGTDRSSKARLPIM